MAIVIPPPPASPVATARLPDIDANVLAPSFRRHHLSRPLYPFA